MALICKLQQQHGPTGGRAHRGSRRHRHNNNHHRHNNSRHNNRWTSSSRLETPPPLSKTPAARRCCGPRPRGTSTGPAPDRPRVTPAGGVCSRRLSTWRRRAPSTWRQCRRAPTRAAACLAALSLNLKARFGYPLDCLICRIRNSPREIAEEIAELMACAGADIETCRLACSFFGSCDGFFYRARSNLTTSYCVMRPVLAGYELPAGTYYSYYHIILIEVT